MKKQFFLVLLLAVFSLILVEQNIKAQEGISVYSTVNYDANNNSVTGHSYTYATYGNSGYYNTEVTSFLVDSDYNLLASNTAYGNLQAILLLAATGRGCDEYKILSSHRTTTQYYVTAFPYSGGYRDGYYDVFDYLFSSEQGQVEDYVNSMFFSALTNPRVLDQPVINLGSTEATTFGNCVIPTIRILRDGQHITSAQNVIVGQRINLSVSVENGTASSPQWTIPGEKVANYVVTYTDETSATSGVVTGLTSQNLSQPSVQFYWIDGGDSRKVQYSATINNRTYTATATFNVKRPTATLTATTGTVGLGTLQAPNNQTVFALHFGDPFGTPGISFSATASLPSGFTGQIVWVQIVNSSRRARKRVGQKEQVLQGSGLDTVFPYGDPDTGNEDDSPREELDVPCDYSSVSANDSFTMWLMFKPGGTSAIYVPLRKLNWSWSGTGTRGITCSSWTLSNPNPSSSQNLTSVSTTDFPLWTTNIQQYDYQ